MSQIITSGNCLDFCGWGRLDAKTMRERVVEAQRLADETASKFAKPFFVAGQNESGAGKSARLDLAVKQVTGKVIQNIPQLTGDCVALAMLRTLMFRAAQQILKDSFEDCKWLFSPYHYATGRVLIGQNRLKGGAGSVGGWQAEAVTKHGFIDYETPSIEYSKGVADAWGDDKKFQGKSFRDFMESAEGQKVLQWARMQSWNEARDAIFHGYPLHICANTGYTMKPNRDGFHTVSGTWPHAMTVFAYWESCKVPCVGISNSWGDVHGTVKDPVTGEPLPPGSLLVPLDMFVSRHLKGSECIAISSADGFDAKIDWSRLAGKTLAT